MGCRTGFYLLVRERDPYEVLSALREALRATAEDAEEMFGASRVECGNYKELDLGAAKKECRRYLEVISREGIDFKYKDGNNG